MKIIHNLHRSPQNILFAFQIRMSNDMWKWMKRERESINEHEQRITYETQNVNSSWRSQLQSVCDFTQWILYSTRSFPLFFFASYFLSHFYFILFIYIKCQKKTETERWRKGKNVGKKAQIISFVFIVLNFFRFSYLMCFFFSLFLFSFQNLDNFTWLV